MADKKYQTIDPLILETLNLNEKRIHHIFDILHGRDNKLDNVSRTPRSVTINVTGNSKLPRLMQQEKMNINSSRAHPQKSNVNRSRDSSTSLIEYQNHSLSNLQNIEQQQHPQSKLRRGQASRIGGKQAVRSARQPTQPELTQPSPTPQLGPTEKKQRLMQDYGMNQLRRNRSLQINPKDVYRLEIQHLISRPTEIEELEDVEKLMKRLKRRYQHLRKFDKDYYIKLSENQILLL